MRKKEEDISTKENDHFYIMDGGRPIVQIEKVLKRFHLTVLWRGNNNDYKSVVELLSIGIENWSTRKPYRKYFRNPPTFLKKFLVGFRHTQFSLKKGAG